MKKTFAILISFAIVILTTSGIVGCSDAQDRDKEFDGDATGAYFMTDESYKKLSVNLSMELSVRLWQSWRCGGNKNGGFQGICGVEKD